MITFRLAIIFTDIPLFFRNISFSILTLSCSGVVLQVDLFLHAYFFWENFSQCLNFGSSSDIIFVFLIECAFRAEGWIDNNWRICIFLRMLRNGGFHKISESVDGCGVLRGILGVEVELFMSAFSKSGRVFTRNHRVWIITIKLSIKQNPIISTRIASRFTTQMNY